MPPHHSPIPGPRPAPLSVALGVLLVVPLALLPLPVPAAPAKAQEEYIKAWAAHVAEHHGGQEALLLDLDRFNAFCESKEQVDVHNARFRRGETPYPLSLNHRAAFLPHEKLWGEIRLQPTAAALLNASLTLSSHNSSGAWPSGSRLARMLLHLRSLQAGGCGQGVGSCTGSNCCSQWNYCGTGDAYCNSNCQRAYSGSQSSCAPAVPSSAPTPASSSGSKPVGLLPKPLDYLNGPPDLRVATKPKSASLSSTLPSSVDWRTKSILNPAQNQGTCGNCYAFAAAAATEAIDAIMTGSLAKLSEQQLTDCSLGAQGCSGGYPDLAFSWIASNGITSSTDYPYIARGQTCAWSGGLTGALSGFGNIPAQSDQALMVALMAQPVIVMIQGDQPAFQNYQAGTVLADPGCTGPDGLTLNHAVLAVGFVGSSPSGYYIIRNLWGSNWGISGYAYLKMTGEYTKGTCGIINNSPIYPVYYNQNNPCAARPCGAGGCQAAGGFKGFYYCSWCPSGFQVSKNPDGSQTCAPNPCEAQKGNPCGPGTCTADVNAPFGYSCSCPSGTAAGLNVDGAPGCVGPGTGGRIYTVQSGDLCYTMAVNNHISLDQFLILNQGINCSLIFPGQQVNVGSWITSSYCTRWYTTVAGDNCWRLWTNAALDANTFYRLNPDISCNPLPIGWQVCLAGNPPAPSPIQACGQIYKVQDGDQCSSIMSRNNLASQTFYSINPGINCGNLEINQPVCVKSANDVVEPPCNKFYRVQKGNTCSDIWRRNGLSERDFNNKNPKIMCGAFKVGVEVCVG